MFALISLNYSLAITTHSYDRSRYVNERFALLIRVNNGVRFQRIAFNKMVPKNSVAVSFLLHGYPDRCRLRHSHLTLQCNLQSWRVLRRGCAQQIPARVKKLNGNKENYFRSALSNHHSTNQESDIAGWQKRPTVAKVIEKGRMVRSVDAILRFVLLLQCIVGVGRGMYT